MEWGYIAGDGDEDPYPLEKCQKAVALEEAPNSCERRREAASRGKGRYNYQIQGCKMARKIRKPSSPDQ